MGAYRSWIIIHLMYVLFTNSGAPENLYKAALCSHVSSQQEEYVHAPVSTVHAKEEDPLLIPESLPTARACGPCHTGGRLGKGRVSGTGRADRRQAGPGSERRSGSLKKARSTRQGLTPGKQQPWKSSWGQFSGKAFRHWSPVLFRLFFFFFLFKWFCHGLAKSCFQIRFRDKPWEEENISSGISTWNIITVINLLDFIHSFYSFPLRLQNVSY